MYLFWILIFLIFVLSMPFFVQSFTLYSSENTQILLDPTLIINLKVTRPNDQAFLNNQIAKFLGLPTSNDYHVIIAIIKGIPRNILKV